MYKKSGHYSNSKIQKNTILYSDYIKEKIVASNIGQITDNYVLWGHCSCAYKRVLLLENDIKYDENKRKEEDQPVMNQALYFAESLIYVDGLYYLYKKRENSLISQYSPRFDNCMSNIDLYKSRFSDSYDFTSKQQICHWIKYVSEENIDFVFAHERDENVDKKTEIMKILTNLEVISWYKNAEGLTGRAAKIQKAIIAGKPDAAYHIANIGYTYKRVRRLGKKLLTSIKK